MDDFDRTWPERGHTLQGQSVGANLDGLASAAYEHGLRDFPPGPDVMATVCRGQDDTMRHLCRCVLAFMPDAVRAQLSDTHCYARREGNRHHFSRKALRRVAKVLRWRERRETVNELFTRCPQSPLKQETAVDQAVGTVFSPMNVVLQALAADTGLTPSFMSTTRPLLDGHDHDRGAVMHAHQDAAAPSKVVASCDPTTCKFSRPSEPRDPASPKGQDAKAKERSFAQRFILPGLDLRRGRARFPDPPSAAAVAALGVEARNNLSTSSPSYRKRRVVASHAFSIVVTRMPPCFRCLAENVLSFQVMAPNSAILVAFTSSFTLARFKEWHGHIASLYFESLLLAYLLPPLATGRRFESGSVLRGHLTNALMCHRYFTGFATVVLVPPDGQAMSLAVEAQLDDVAARLLEANGVATRPQHWVPTPGLFHRDDLDASSPSGPFQGNRQNSGEAASRRPKVSSSNASGSIHTLLSHGLNKDVENQKSQTHSDALCCQPWVDYVLAMVDKRHLEALRRGCGGPSANEVEVPHFGEGSILRGDAVVAVIAWLEQLPQGILQPLSRWSVDDNDDEVSKGWSAWALLLSSTQVPSPPRHRLKSGKRSRASVVFDVEN